MNQTRATNNRLILSMSLSAVVLGVMLATQYRITQQTHERLEVQSGGAAVSELQNSVENVRKKNIALENQINQLNKQLLALEGEAGSATKDIREELETARIEAGTTAVEGSGISFSVSDDSSLKHDQPVDLSHYVHDADVRRLVTELYLAGAEAVSINDQRITYASRIQCIGPTITIDDHKSTIPFVFKAIGDKETLVKSLTFPGGIIDYLKQTRHLSISAVNIENSIQMSPYTGAFNDMNLNQDTIPETKQ